MSDLKLHEELYDEYMMEEVGLTITECIAKSWQDAKQGFMAYETIDTYHKKSYNRPEKIYFDSAFDSIDYWRNHFMVRRLQGYDISSPWQKGMIELVNNPDNIAKHKQLKLIATLPKYTEIQQRWDNYEVEYTSSKRQDFNFNKKLSARLELVDKYSTSTKNKKAHQVFVFKNVHTNELFVYNSDNSGDGKLFLETILSCKDDVIDCIVWTSTTEYTKNFLFKKIKVFESLK